MKPLRFISCLSAARLVVLSMALCSTNLFCAPLSVGDPIAVPGTKGKFDCLRVDEELHRLLASHTANGTLDVINLPDGKLIKSVATGAAQDVAVDVQRDRYYVTVSDQKKLAVVDRKTLAVTGGIELPGAPDCCVFQSKSGFVYAGHDDEEDLWAIDPVAQKIVATIKIPAAPEFAVYDADADQIFQNIKSKPVTLAIDPNANSIKATWSNSPVEKPHGLAIDPQTHRLFSAGGNGKLAVLDSTSGANLMSVEIAAGVDQIAFDAGKKRIYCASGQGKVSVLEETAEGVKSLGDVVTPTGAHTLAVDPATHSVWIAYAKGTAAYVTELKAP
jgi:DNA-binding beta-propeller fold protein YncE